MRKMPVFQIIPTFIAILVLSSSAWALRAEVRNHLGSPMLFINEVPQVPLIFMGGGWFGKNEFLAPQVRLADGAGIHIYQINLCLPWALPDGNSPDYSVLDSGIRTVLEADPNAFILPRVNVTEPGWWIEKHPDQRMLYSDGPWTKASIASKIWRQDVLENLRSFIRHCEEKYGDHIIGYHPAGQETDEWFYFRSWEPVHNSFEEPFRQGFVEWLKNKYKTDSRLQKVWQQSDITFETIHVPTIDERTKASNGLFRDPVKERFVVDFYEYQNVAMAEVLEDMARLIKQETGGRKLACFFYGYFLCLANLPNGVSSGGHSALQRILTCPDIDILCSPISYRDRQPGGCGPFMVPVDSIRDAGKLWLHEEDTRTYLSADNVSNNFYGRAATLDQTVWTHQRNFANLLPRRLGCWYTDLPSLGWLNSKEIWENIAQMRRVYLQELSRPASWQPEVAIIVDEKSPSYLAANNILTDPLIFEFRKQFYRMGTGFRINLLSDVLSGRLKLPKVTFFPGCLHLTDTEREKLLLALKGKTAVWFYGSGYLDNVRGSIENMRKLTGFSFTENTQGGPATITFDADNPFTSGLAGSVYRPEIDCQRPKPASFPDTILAPIWSVKDVKNIIRLAHFADGTTAAALKNTGNYKSIYIGTAGCPAKLVRNILRFAGIHLYIDSDDVLLTDGRFLSLTASLAGTKKIFVPKGMTLRDIYTKEQIPVTDGIARQDFVLAQTRQYFLEPAK